MSKIWSYILSFWMCITSCATHKLPEFSSQHWHIDSYSGNAISTSGMELALGSEWLLTDNSILQTSEQIAPYPDLSSHIAEAIAQFPEIKVDSILFYSPRRKLLFATYHQVKPLKPTTEIFLYDDLSDAEYTRLFGYQNTNIDDSGWENGPSNSVYTNVHYRPKNKQIVLLQRIPYQGNNIAVFHIWTTIPRKGKWWEKYPRGTFWNINLGNTDNIESISSVLHSSRTVAVSNLRLASSKP